MKVDEIVGAAERHSRYLERAQEAEQKAIMCAEPDARRTWEELARSWRFLAQQVARDFRL